MTGFSFSIRTIFHIDLKGVFSALGRRAFPKLPIICIMLSLIGLVNLVAKNDSIIMIKSFSQELKSIFS